VASYSLQFRKPVAKDLHRIPKPALVRILERIDALADETGPPGSEKLSRQERYRIRQGRSRILSEITDDTLVVTVVKVAPAARVSLIQRNPGDEPLAPPETPAPLSPHQTRGRDGYVTHPRHTIRHRSGGLRTPRPHQSEQHDCIRLNMPAR